VGSIRLYDVVRGESGPSTSFIVLLLVKACRSDLLSIFTARLQAIPPSARESRVSAKFPPSGETRRQGY
jgi:hypothetical protein